MTTVGVEEEFLLLDRHSGVNVPAAEKVFAALPAELRQRSRREFRQSMVEMVTDVCTGAAELHDQLLAGRRAASAAADGTGAMLVAVGATPVAETVREPAEDGRFDAITDFYGPIARDPALCGCHVHVGVPNRQAAVQICTRLRGWLPVVQALAVNSPVHEGADSGFASWRFAQLARWPGLGPWPHLETEQDFARTVKMLVAAGEMRDETMVLWFARPSAAFPTVEVRVADVCPEAADTVLLAALIRALVTTVADEPAHPPVDETALRAAHWNAARTGLDGTLLDARSGRPRPAWDLVGELVERVTPALRRHGDLGLVTAGLDRVRRDGTGAVRQRRLLREYGGTTAMLGRMALATTAG